jgi:NADH:ubiquinone oxidoreductase subunit K
VFTTGTSYSGKELLRIAILPAVILLTLPTELNIVSIDSYGQNTVAGPVYALLVPYLIAYFFIGLKKLVQVYRNTAEPLIRLQIRYIFTGILLGFIPGVVLNGILPVFGYDRAVFYGPSAIIFTAIFMTIVITRHKFLDVRSFVFKAVVYLLSVAVIGLLYTTLVYGVGGIFVDIDNVTSWQRILFASLALVIAVTYAPIVKLFNKYTTYPVYKSGV